MRKNNKGFTLVELIIVIAIIAILATVFAPMYTKYIESAKEANDKKIATSYVQAATVALLDGYAGEKELTDEWYVFKWGYDTGGKGGMNVHMGTATVDSENKPTGIVGDGRVLDLQQEVAQIMGWPLKSDGNVDESKIYRPESSSVQPRSGWHWNSFIFYVNRITGEVFVDSTISKNWVDIVGVEAQLN